MPRKSTRTTITKQKQTLSEISVTGNQRVLNFWFYMANKNQIIFEVFHGCNVPKILGTGILIITVIEEFKFRRGKTSELK